MSNSSSHKDGLTVAYRAQTQKSRKQWMKKRLQLEMKQRIEQMRSRSNEFQEELRAMDGKALEKEQKALLADIVGETEFLKSLQNQIEKLKGISQLVKCPCGQEYKI
ncbi:uncharacterized protein LOC115732417 isoform X5 [Rhodamnia argentea]|uniref:Uncharacterized protein LOC115732417 isoform X5 n=1 Tax=Rhodamnia argentea TaxID=178133 RepID=A0ABM3H0N4_9MYRT|nr:uncharacterized protein LOC115732417 isoform X5 [Rhodamnia argentea]